MNAIITAGGVPKAEDLLFPYTNGLSKSLIDVAGKPMIQWVLDALCASAKIKNIVIIGLAESDGLSTSKPTYYVPNQGSMLSNIVVGFSKVQEIDPTANYIVIASSDIPDLKSNMVDWLIDEVEKEPADIYYGIVQKQLMEKTYPDSRRTWTKLKDMELCGADINVAHVSMATEHLDTWDKLIGQRKSPLKQAATIGITTLFLLATKQITLNDLVERVSKSIGIKGKALIWPWAEAGMDVDKPHQLEIIRKSLSKAHS